MEIDLPFADRAAAGSGTRSLRRISQASGPSEKIERTHLPHELIPECARNSRRGRVEHRLAHPIMLRRHPSELKDPEHDVDVEQVRNADRR